MTTLLPTIFTETLPDTDAFHMKRKNCLDTNFADLTKNAKMGDTWLKLSKLWIATYTLNPKLGLGLSVERCFYNILTYPPEKRLPRKIFKQIGNLHAKVWRGIDSSNQTRYYVGSDNFVQRTDWINFSVEVFDPFQRKQIDLFFSHLQSLT